MDPIHVQLWSCSDETKRCQHAHLRRFATSWEQNFCCRQRTAIFLRHYVLLEIIIVVDMQVSAQVHIAAFV